MTACPEPWMVVALGMIGVVIAAVLLVQADHCYRQADRFYRQSRRLCDETLADMERRHERLLKTLREVMP